MEIKGLRKIEPYVAGKLRTHEIKDDTFLRAYANSG